MCSNLTVSDKRETSKFFPVTVDTIHMKATEQDFPVKLFMTLYKMVLTLESVNEILSEVWLFK